MIPRAFSIRIGFAVLLSTLAAGAIAADPAPSSAALQRYEQERARCLSGQSPQDLDACLREARAALQTARQGRTEDPPSDLEQNRLRRCDVHPTPADREECIRRMQFGVTSGSVEGGGVLRELRTIEMQ